jgi:hypothetical protein
MMGRTDLCVVFVLMDAVFWSSWIYCLAIDAMYVDMLPGITWIVDLTRQCALVCACVEANADSRKHGHQSF